MIVRNEESVLRKFSRQEARLQTTDEEGDDVAEVIRLTADRASVDPIPAKAQGWFMSRFGSLDWKWRARKDSNL